MLKKECALSVDCIYIVFQGGLCLKFVFRSVHFLADVRLTAAGQRHRSRCQQIEQMSVMINAAVRGVYGLLWMQRN